MFKIKLLILLLFSIVLISCSSNKNQNNVKLSVGYIGGEYDGLMLSNQLKGNLSNFAMYDKNSEFEIQANINHSNNVFITNIDNTSDRERITSSIDVKIYNKANKCHGYSFATSVSQFYILASSDKFTSNKAARDEIKFSHTENLIRQFIHDVNSKSFDCESPLSVFRSQYFDAK